MAKNMVHRDAQQLSVTCSDPTTPASGDPVRCGERCGVALTAERADGTTSVQFHGGFTLSVKAIDGSGSSAVVQGDKLYYVDADTPKISKKATGHFFGYAAAAVTGGATASIEVWFNN